MCNESGVLRACRHGAASGLTRLEISAEFLLKNARVAVMDRGKRWNPPVIDGRWHILPQRMQADFRLGDWVVQSAQCRLSKDGQTLRVRARVMDLRVYLAAHPGEASSGAGS
jgi:DNA-binding response OmpR family regulator